MEGERKRRLKRKRGRAEEEKRVNFISTPCSNLRQSENKLIFQNHFSKMKYSVSCRHGVIQIYVKSKFFFGYSFCEISAFYVFLLFSCVGLAFFSAIFCPFFKLSKRWLRKTKGIRQRMLIAFTKTH